VQGVVTSDEVPAGSLEKRSIILFGPLPPAAPAHHVDIEKFREMRFRRARHDVLGNEDAAARFAVADRLQNLYALIGCSTDRLALLDGFDFLDFAFLLRNRRRPMVAVATIHASPRKS
jgi:hypothetical protein